jgi:hypothetical protein
MKKELPRIIITKLNRIHVKHFDELQTALYKDSRAKKKPNSKILWEASKQFLEEKGRMKVLSDQNKKYEEEIAKQEQKYQVAIARIFSEYKAFKEEIKAYFLFIQDMQKRVIKDSAERVKKEKKIIRKVVPRLHSKKNSLSSSPGRRGLSQLLKGS